MNKVIKWVIIVGGGLVALVIIALLIVPSFVDLQSYKPRIEKMVSEATGRPFSIGGDIDLSLFPWVGFSSSDIHLGNPLVSASCIIDVLMHVLTYRKIKKLDWIASSLMCYLFNEVG